MRLHFPEELRSDMSDEADLDGLELELRQLPGVVGVGVEQTPQALVVQLLVTRGMAGTDLRRRACELGRSHVADRMIIEIAAAGETASAQPPQPRPERARLLAVRLCDDEDHEVEVHLALGESRSVGRGHAGRVAGAVTATVDALEILGARVSFELRSFAAVRLEEGQEVVVVQMTSTGDEGERLGVARSTTLEEAAARAAMHALNRYLEGDDAFEDAGSRD